MRALTGVMLCAIIALCSAGAVRPKEEQKKLPLAQFLSQASHTQHDTGRRDLSGPHPTSDAASGTVSTPDEDIGTLSTPSTDIEIPDALCQRRSLLVNFREIGLERIIAPKDHDVGCCGGECPLSMMYRLNGTNHTYMKTVAQTAIPAAPKACCVPTKFSPMSLLYFDEDMNVVMATLENMQVESCGCR